MDVVVGDVYKVRVGYNCFVGCNVIEGGRVVEVTDSNLDILRSQKHKLENHITKKPVVPIQEMVTEEKPKPKRKVKDKMTRTIRSK